MKITFDPEVLTELRDYARNRLKFCKKFSVTAADILQRLGYITKEEAVAAAKVKTLERTWRKAVELETSPEHLILATTAGYCIAFTEEEKQKALRPKSSNQ